MALTVPGGGTTISSTSGVPGLDEALDARNDYPNPQMVRNGLFDRQGEWDEVTDWDNGTIENGVLSVATDGSLNGAAQVLTNLIVGDWYELNVEPSTGSARVYVGDAAAPATLQRLNEPAGSADTINKFYFTATATSHSIGLRASSANTTVGYRSISVRKAALPLRLKDLALTGSPYEYDSAFDAQMPDPADYPVGTKQSVSGLGSATGLPTTATYVVQDVNGSNAWVGEHSLDLAVGQELTIASGAVTVTGFADTIWRTIDTEADAATDDLDLINGGIPGQKLILSSANNTRDPSLIDGANIRLHNGGPVALGSSNDRVTLICSSPGTWIQLTQHANN